VRRWRVVDDEQAWHLATSERRELSSDRLGEAVANSVHAPGFEVPGIDLHAWDVKNCCGCSGRRLRYRKGTAHCAPRYVVGVSGTGYEDHYGAFNLKRMSHQRCVADCDDFF
jgi:hypothetical protein